MRSKPVSETSPVSGDEPDPTVPASEPVPTSGGGGDPDGSADGAGVLPRGPSASEGGGAPDGSADGAGVLPRGIDRPGSGADPARPAQPARPTRPTRPTRIDLEVSRQRSISWTIFGLLLGALLIRVLGTVGVWAGIVLVGMGVYHAWQLIQTLLYAPGTITVSDREIALPRGLCLPRPLVVKPEDITAIYFLRRSVPWNRSAPVLIVELGPRAMAFPRDWFASEADQRHVIHAVQRAKGQTLPPSSDDAAV